MLLDRVKPRLLGPDDAKRAVALTEKIGWSQNAATWANFIRWGGEGSFCIAQGDQLIATSVALRYSPALAWIGTVITHPDYQRQGLARRMMQTSLDYLHSKGTRCIMLDASEMGRPLYEGLGFRALYKLEVFAGEAIESDTPADTRALTEADVPDITALDAQIFGVARGEMIRDLAIPGHGWVSSAAGNIGGYLLLKSSNLGINIGPWYHQSVDGAESLFRRALTFAKGQQVRVYIPEPNSDAKTLVRRYGLMPTRFTTRMVLGDDPPGDMARQYSVAALATG